LETSSGKKERIPPFFHLIKEPRILADIYAVFADFALLASFDSDLGFLVKNLFGWGSTGAGSPSTPGQSTSPLPCRFFSRL